MKKAVLSLSVVAILFMATPSFSLPGSSNFHNWSGAQRNGRVRMNHDTCPSKPLTKEEEKEEIAKGIVVGFTLVAVAIFLAKKY